jgi:hypothetical protein
LKQRACAGYICTRWFNVRSARRKSKIRNLEDI